MRTHAVTMKLKVDENWLYFYRTMQDLEPRATRGSFHLDVASVIVEYTTDKETADAMATLARHLGYYVTCEPIMYGATDATSR